MRDWTIGIFIALLLTGCSLDYRGAGYAEEPAASIPDTILYDFSTTSVHGTGPFFQVRAARAETFNKKNLTLMDGIAFKQFGSDGSVVAQGTADQAVYHTDTGNAELSGHIEVYSAKEKAHISTGWLSWDNAEGVLHGKANGVVLVKKDDGSQIQGVGFEAELKTRTIKFSGGVKGVWVKDSGR